LTEARLILAPLAARNGDTASALEHFGMALPDLDSHRELIPSFVNVALELVRHGLAAEVSDILSGENGRTVEPLAVALMLARGENPPVAKEILEVARDIADRLSASLAKAEPAQIEASPRKNDCRLKRAVLPEASTLEFWMNEGKLLTIAKRLLNGRFEGVSRPRLYPVGLPQGCDSRSGNWGLQPIAQCQLHRARRALHVSNRRAGDPP
jgi:hypothetical protein